MAIAAVEVALGEEVADSGVAAVVAGLEVAAAAEVCVSDNIILNTEEMVK